MRILLLLALLTLSFDSAHEQSNQRLDKISDDRLVSVLNNLKILAEKKTDDLSIRIFAVGNPSGSAEQPSSEITHNVYITVSEYDEAPKQSLHTYGPLYNPKVISLTGQSSEQVLTLQQGPAASRKQVKLKVSIANVTVLK